MAIKRTVLTQTDRSFWRDVYRDALSKLIARFAGRRSRKTLAEDAGAHADLAVEQLRKRASEWGRS